MKKSAEIAVMEAQLRFEKRLAKQWGRSPKPGTEGLCQGRSDMAGDQNRQTTRLVLGREKTYTGQFCSTEKRCAREE